MQAMLRHLCLYPQCAKCTFTVLQAAVVATVSCSAQTTAANIIQKLEQMCGNPVSTNAGRVLRPKVSPFKPTVVYPDITDTLSVVGLPEQTLSCCNFAVRTLCHVASRGCLALTRSKLCSGG